MELDTNSPVNYAESIEIKAPIGTVWQIMSDINHWPDWKDDIKAAQLAGNLEPGTSFTWKSGPGTITSQLLAVEPKQLLAWSGKTMGIKAVHIWRLEESGSGTRVTTEESWNGLPARLLKSYSKKTLARAINSGLKLLKQTAENT